MAMCLWQNLSAELSSMLGKIRCKRTYIDRVANNSFLNNLEKSDTVVLCIGCYFDSAWTFFSKFNASCVVEWTLHGQACNVKNTNIELKEMFHVFVF